MLNFFTDPHLGVNRIAGTTQESRIRLTKTIFDSTRRAAIMTGRAFCLGDLFDTYSNPESIIQMGGEIFRLVEKVMSGNHDVSNRASAFGSFELLASLYPEKAWYTPFGLAFAHTSLYENTFLVSIPHTIAQDLFIEGLTQAEAAAKGASDKDYYKILLLHCNVGSPFDLPETALHLTLEWAERLLKKFNYILVGHEHQPRELLDGRLIVLGNVHPTGFSDISDKYVYSFSQSTGMFTKTKVWDQKEHYLELNWREQADLRAKQFLKLTGDMDQQEVPLLAKRVSQVWNENPTLLAVKVDVRLQEAYTASPTKVEDNRTLATRITAALRSGNDQEIFEMWKQLSENHA
jgi:DNA repair exonuclease SbcCD nuclease subunit